MKKQTAKKSSKKKPRRSSNVASSKYTPEALGGPDEPAFDLDVVFAGMTQNARNSLKYKPEFNQAVVKWMAQGYSFHTFGVTVGVTYETVNNWRKEFPDFAYAVELAYAMNRIYWEKLSKRNSVTNAGNAAGIKFNLTNRFRHKKAEDWDGSWSDSSNIDLTTKGEKVTEKVDLSNANEATLRKLIDELGSKSAKG